MAMTVRALLRLMAGSVAALLGRSAISVAQERSPAGSMAALIAKLRSDPSLRARFLGGPSAVMREEGIDPTPYSLPSRLTQAQLDRLLADWPRTDGQAQASTPRVAQSSPAPPAVVYGPPAGPPRTQGPQPLPPRTEGPQPNPPAPVYGPPPRPPR
jgi:hypothetical protein